ncbi:MFS transporter, partial [Salmonella enterica subsp. enterica serovar Montevideo]|nr:MFS transporter [Salmonella enterica subsp. enterica serovar Montevideo]
KATGGALFISVLLVFIIYIVSLSLIEHGHPGLGFTLFGLLIANGAMVPAITKNPHERAQLAAWRQGGATIGLLLCTVGFMPIQAL